MAVVLIVEDEVFIRQNAEWMVEDLGHSALLAGDPEEALICLSTPGRIDALFVDIRLGGVAHGGYAIADHAVQARPDLRVLYTSGSTLTDEVAKHFVRGGRFLQKPYSSEQLEAALADLLETVAL
jgi:CheY-like chemotaxis protein